MRFRYLHLITFTLFLCLNIGFWAHSKDVKAQWLNVPSAPSIDKATLNFLGDKEMAYRSYAIMLQNMGSLDGEAQALKSYNYANLKDWFLLENQFNSKADIVPLLAAYYFGGVSDPDRLRYVLDYLEVVGQSPEGEKWRWLGHAVFLARHTIEDNDLALRLAYLLADNKSPTLGDWAKQMPVFILQSQGRTDLAYDLMINLLVTNVDKMDPHEIFFMKEYICNTLVPEQKGLSPPSFCEEIKAND